MVSFTLTKPLVYKFNFAPAQFSHYQAPSGVDTQIPDLSLVINANIMQNRPI